MAKEIEPHTVRIGPYRKNSRLIVKGFVRSYVNSLEAADEHNTVEPASAYVEIKAAPEDWRKLQRFLLDDPDAFSQALLKYFIEPVVEYVEEKEGVLPRGKHKDAKEIVQKLQRQSPWLYVFFQFWCKRPECEFPEYLKQLIAMAEREGYGPNIKKDTRYSPQGLTEYCISKVHGKEIAQYDLAPSGDDPSSFYITYVQGKIKTVQKGFTSHKADPKYVASLVYKIGPLKDIFQALHLI
jgi:hypothetical protein